MTRISKIKSDVMLSRCSGTVADLEKLTVDQWEIYEKYRSMKASNQFQIAMIRRKVPGSYCPVNLSHYFGEDYWICKMVDRFIENTGATNILGRLRLQAVEREITPDNDPGWQKGLSLQDIADKIDCHINTVKKNKSTIWANYIRPHHGRKFKVLAGAIERMNRDVSSRTHKK